MDIVKKPILQPPKISKSTVEHLPSEIKTFFTPDNWPYWAGAVLVVLLVALLCYLIVRRRRRQKLPEAPAPTKPEPKKEEMPPTTLLDIWKTFLRRVPSRFRQAVGRYDVYVVMGESGAGKSLLIDHYTDWEGRSLQFNPSYTENPLLQIYLGSGVVVQELSPSILNDASESARAALAALWKRTFRNRMPRAVVVLNVAALESVTPDSLKRQAYSIRGKLNELSQCCRVPVEVCIALTHMEQVEGFTPFRDFLRKNDIPLNIRFSSDGQEIAEAGGKIPALSPTLGAVTTLDRLETCLEAYEDLLPQALTTQSATDFLQIISFMRRGPTLFSRLSAFIDVLRSPDVLSASPEVVQLILAANVNGDRNASSPFAAHFTRMDKVRKGDSVSRHRLIAGAILVLGLAYLLVGFFYEHRLVSATYQRIEEILGSPALEDDYKIDTLFLDFDHHMRVSPLTFLPDYFPGASGEIRNGILDHIRGIILLPMFEKIETDDDYTKKLTYLTALVYASETNDIGKMIVDKMDEWSRVLGLPETLIRSYIAFSKKTWDGVIPMETRGLKQKIINPEEYIQPWLVFFLEISKAAKMPYITGDRLQQYQQTAANLQGVIAEVKDYNSLLGIQMVLAKDAPMSGMPFMTPIALEYPDLFRESMVYLMSLIQKYDVTYPQVTDLTLGQLFDNLKVMMDMPSRFSEKFKFNIPFKEFSLTVKDWLDLIHRSRITLFIKGYMAVNALRGGAVFFPGHIDLTQIAMNPTNDGTLFFTGKATLDGRFTAEGFNQYVKPVLIEAPGILQKLPVGPREAEELSGFVYRAAEAYAAGYLSEYERYYSQFGMQANSLPSLKYVLTQIQQQSSDFQSFFITLKDNTQFTLEKQPYLNPFVTAMQSFSFVGRMMQEKKGEAPDLEKYKGIIRQMLQDISSDTPAQGKEKKANALVECLSPLGRISLSIFLNEEGSYLNLVKKWVGSVDIASEWQQPFLQPVYLTYALGITEVESAVNAIWNDLKENYILAFIDKFPFNREAKEEISSDWLRRSLAPKGEFWQKAEGYLLPVCQRNEDNWSELPASVDVFKLPADMLTTLNQMERLKRNMWDEKGKPIPIAISVKPTPLPPLSDYGSQMPVAVMSYLRLGKSIAFGFNQQPEWLPFTIEWWGNQEACVGVSFVGKGESNEGYGSITGPVSEWSFYRLLQKGTEVARNVYRWEISDTSRAGERTTVEFLFKDDLWSLFTLPKMSAPSGQITVRPLALH